MRFVVVAVSEDAVGPLLAQQEKQKVIQVVALDDQGAIVGNG